jgi:hypothetical protein
VHLGDSLTIICSSILRQLIDVIFGVWVKRQGRDDQKGNGLENE